MSSNPLAKRIKYALRFLPDEAYIQLYYFARFHRFANLKHPTTFNEKLQWLKLHNRNPLYNTLVDKYAMKKWVADNIGGEYVIPAFACWESADDIDISDLPERFVLKTNHDCGGVVICHDRATFDLDAAKAKMAATLRIPLMYCTP